MSSGSTQPFRPSGTATLAASTTAANTALVGRGEAALVFNASAAPAFIRFGTDNTVAANAADVPVPAGARMLIHCSTFTSTVSALLLAGTGTVYVSRGEGTVY